jgi:hypothetical protein
MDQKLISEAIRAIRARRRFVQQEIFQLEDRHVSDHDLERYHLGMIPDGPELDALEEHLLVCGECVDRAEETANYVDAMRAGIVRSQDNP